MPGFLAWGCELHPSIWRSGRGRCSAESPGVAVTWDQGVSMRSGLARTFVALERNSRMRCIVIVSRSLPDSLFTLSSRNSYFFAQVSCIGVASDNVQTSFVCPTGSATSAQDSAQDVEPTWTSFCGSVRCFRIMPLYADVFAEPEYRLYIGLTVMQKRSLQEGGTILGSYQGRFGLRRKPAEVPWL